jgi:hypothetical protein
VDNNERVFYKLGEKILRKSRGFFDASRPALLLFAGIPESSSHPAVAGIAELSGSPATPTVMAENWSPVVQNDPVLLKITTASCAPA